MYSIQHFWNQFKFDFDDTKQYLLSLINANNPLIHQSLVNMAEIGLLFCMKIHVSHDCTLELDILTSCLVNNPICSTRYLYIYTCTYILYMRQRGFLHCVFLQYLLTWLQALDQSLVLWTLAEVSTIWPEK